MVTRDDVAHGKPAPDSFTLAADCLGIPASDCLALEDSACGIAAAHAAGMMVVMVPDVVAPKPETVQRCTAVLATLDDVGRLLETGRIDDRSRFRV